MLPAHNFASNTLLTSDNLVFPSILGGSGGGAGVDLSPAMTAEALQPLLSNPEFVEKLKPFLPATSEPISPSEQLKGTVTSPQFKQVR